MAQSKTVWLYVYYLQADIKQTRGGKDNEEHLQWRQTDQEEAGMNVAQRLRLTFQLHSLAKKRGKTVKEYGMLNYKGKTLFLVLEAIKDEKESGKALSRLYAIRCLRRSDEQFTDDDRKLVNDAFQTLKEYTEYVQACERECRQG